VPGCILLSIAAGHGALRVSIIPSIAPGDRLGFVLQHKYCRGLRTLSYLSFPEALKGPDRVLYAALQQAGLKPRWADLAAQQLYRCSTGMQAMPVTHIEAVPEHGLRRVGRLCSAALQHPSRHSLTTH